MNYIILDLEWNQSPTGKINENKAIPFEIIEIGAVKLNKDKEILDYKDNHKDTKEEHHMPFIFIVIVGIILLIAALLIKYLLDNKE